MVWKVEGQWKVQSPFVSVRANHLSRVHQTAREMKVISTIEIYCKNWCQGWFSLLHFTHPVPCWVSSRSSILTQNSTETRQTKGPGSCTGGRCCACQCWPCSGPTGLGPFGVWMPRSHVAWDRVSLANSTERDRTLQQGLANVCKLADVLTALQRGWSCCAVVCIWTHRAVLVIMLWYLVCDTSRVGITQTVWSRNRPCCRKGKDQFLCFLCHSERVALFFGTNKQTNKKQLQKLCTVIDQLQWYAYVVGSVFMFLPTPYTAILSGRFCEDADMGENTHQVITSLWRKKEWELCFIKSSTARSVGDKFFPHCCFLESWYASSSTILWCAIELRIIWHIWRKILRKKPVI